MEDASISAITNYFERTCGLRGEVVARPEAEHAMKMVFGILIIVGAVILMATLALFTTMNSRTPLRPSRR